VAAGCGRILFQIEMYNNIITTHARGRFQEQTKNRNKRVFKKYFKCDTCVERGVRCSFRNGRRSYRSNQTSVADYIFVCTG